MLIVLTVSLVVASVWIACVKRNKEATFLMGLCLSLMFEICGIMIFIAKKGGISGEVIQFFFFSKEVKNQIQYLMITLNQMGYLVAVGRTLFPFFLIELAISYSMIRSIRKNEWLARGIIICPLLTLIIYIPEIYRVVTLNNPDNIVPLNAFVMAWMTIYIVGAVYLLLYEYFAISIKFSKKQFSHIVVCLTSLTGIYLLFYQQDPGQIYHFYHYSFKWNSSAGYLQVNPSIFSYVILVGVSVFGCILGFVSLFSFTRIHFESSREDVVMERKFDTAKVGASTFVHSMKNQLLASRVIYKRIGQLYEQPELDMVKLKEYVDALEDFNNTMLTRMEELYRCVKSNAIYMVPTPMEELLEDTLERFHKKYPDTEVRVEQESNLWVLTDKVHMCEALYNLLINAKEAVESAERGAAGEVAIVAYNARQYTVIEVRDNGSGIPKNQAKKIFEPFYSSKNSNSNWGMGLYYVREIIKSHLGSLQVESKEGEGSTFFVLLPRYETK